MAFTDASILKNEFQMKLGDAVRLIAAAQKAVAAETSSSSPSPASSSEGEAATGPALAQARPLRMVNVSTDTNPSTWRVK